MEHENMTPKEACLYINDISKSYQNRKNHLHALNLAKDALEGAEALINKFVTGMNVHYQGDNPDDAIECPFCGYEVASNDDYEEIRPEHCPKCGTKLIY
jgi:DNA-directed RNA polymerase subunit RPC12/RpoP